ncbi:MAG: GAF domain-containing protein [Acidobacteriaceae bacterium]|nr:GAF domain-containing protein [Acidobacteriaceae bacterium]
MTQMGVVQRYQSLLQVNKIALTKPTTEGVFTGMCRVLRKLVPYDRAGLSVYDPEHDSLRIVYLYGRHENSMFHVGYLINRKTSQSGWVFENKTTMVRCNLATEPRFPRDQDIVAEGYHSFCSVPLVVRGNSIGVVSLLGRRKHSLSRMHANVLEELSNQIALAISSMNPRCPSHAHTRLVCPRCIGAAGGKSTVSKHRQDLSVWGKRGGRGRKGQISLE